MKKTKGTRAPEWVRHDDMLINLKDWIGREVNNLKDAIAKSSPQLLDDPKVAGSFRSVDELTDNLFVTLDTIVTTAEKASPKSPAT